jgi:hypothetical protein
MPRLTVPDEIWVLIAKSLTIDDIESLALVSTVGYLAYLFSDFHAQTCRGLHTLLSASVSLWRAVVLDLLAISPNVSLSRVLNNEPARRLHQKALRFRDVDRVLSRNDPRLVQSKDFTLARLAQLDSLRIVPGIPFALYASSAASLHLISLLTGAEVHVWRPSDTITCTETEVQLCSSAKYGLVVLVMVEIESP